MTRYPSSLQRPHRLRAGVVELRALADDDRTGADQQDGREVSPLAAFTQSLQRLVERDRAAPSRWRAAAWSRRPPGAGCRRAASATGSGSGRRRGTDQRGETRRTARPATRPRPAATLYTSPGAPALEQQAGRPPPRPARRSRSRTGSRLPVGTAVAPDRRAARRRSAKRGHDDTAGSGPARCAETARATMTRRPGPPPRLERRDLRADLAGGVGGHRRERIGFPAGRRRAHPVDLAGGDEQHGRIAAPGLPASGRAPPPAGRCPRR